MNHLTDPADQRTQHMLTQHQRTIVVGVNCPTSRRYRTPHVTLGRVYSNQITGAMATSEHTKQHTQ